ncbi:hypothetical protein [Tamlana sp. I1]|uniref:hypothetical protein n=1 Tax=Tamlana sp. I1 TaxID=2762061 RepID=UPI00188E2F05|nr:hypothetical protein [Tamlana sp. I1]
MNEDITERIEQYLYLDTNYAIIINGDYGIGKTHYVKNDLFPRVKELNVPNDEKEEKFTPILISLFGAKSIEDIQNQIFLELYPILKSKGVKITAGLTNSVLKFFGNDLKDILAETGASGNNLSDYSKILICIDDIDRKAKELDLKEVFGFVNNLVENLGAKIILIANEDELRKEIDVDRDNYSLLREKVIGISVSYSANVAEIYDKIINSKYEEKKLEYYRFLNENKKVITLRIQQNNNNLRNLLFFLEHFKIIFSGVNEYFNKDNLLKEFHSEILSQILNFTLPISIEYKSGVLKPEFFEDIRNIYKGGLFNLSAILSDNNNLKIKSKEEKIKTYSEIYEEKYIDKNTQKKNQYFDTIFNYITGTSSFDIKELISEIKNIYQIEGSKIPDREKALQKLSYWQCIDLPLNEYRKLTNQMLTFVDKGAYNLDQYPTIIHYATRFNNVLNLNINNLKKRFKRGIKKGKYKHQDSFHFRISISANTEFYDDVMEVAEYCIELNKQTKLNSDNEETKALFELFKTDFKGFLGKVNEPNTSLRYSPIFSKFNFNKFWTYLKKVKNTELIEFGFDLNRRYRKSVYPDLNPEKEFLEQLKSKLEIEIAKQKTKKIDKIAFDFVLKKTIESIDNFE